MQHVLDRLPEAGVLRPSQLLVPDALQERRAQLPEARARAVDDRSAERKSYAAQPERYEYDESWAFGVCTYCAELQSNVTVDQRSSDVRRRTYGAVPD